MSGYFDNVKREKFPEIKDFSDAQDELRNTVGHELSLGDWFWFNPAAYRYMRVGIPSCFVVNSLVCILLGLWFDIGFLIFLGGIIMGISLWKLFGVLKEFGGWKKTKTNFYDIHLRDY